MSKKNKKPKMVIVNIKVKPGVRLTTNLPAWLPFPTQKQLQS